MFEVIYDRIKHGTISVFPMIRGEISESVYIDKLQETFPSLSDNDCSEILQQHACKIEEIIFVYWDFETAVKALAEVGIYVIQIEYIIKSLLYIKVLRKTNKCKFRLI